MKYFKRLFSTLIAALLVVTTLAGCGVSSDNQSTTKQNFQIGGTIEYDDSASIESDNDVDDSVSSESDNDNDKQQISEDEDSDETTSLDEDGQYYSKEDVALYLYTYGKLPKNFIRKNDATKLGWVSNKGNLWEVAYGMAIGGDNFGNREGKLPKDKKYFECDIDYNGGYRNEKRIVYTKDGYIYYTEDHYQTFELLYGEE